MNLISIRRHCLRMWAGCDLFMKRPVGVGAALDEFCQSKDKRTNLRRLQNSKPSSYILVMWNRSRRKGNKRFRMYGRRREIISLIWSTTDNGRPTMKLLEPRCHQFSHRNLYRRRGEKESASMVAEKGAIGMDVEVRKSRPAVQCCRSA